MGEKAAPNAWGISHQVGQSIRAAVHEIAAAQVRLAVYRICKRRVRCGMTWNPHQAVRSRREFVGLSQTALAEKLGISKSLLCQIEAGQRVPTHAQVEALATALAMPSELLELAGGRLPEDVQGVIASNAAAAVSAIRQQLEAQVISYPIQPPVIECSNRVAPSKHESIPDRITAAKTSTAYRAHSYHTKVPTEAITPFIDAFSSAGDLVFDPFCGSGMTGVAALMAGRNALLSDLSSAAVHIAHNYNTPCPPMDLARAFEEVYRSVGPTIEWLYRSPGDEMVEYTTWSDIFRCPSCGQEILYWDFMVANVSKQADAVCCLSCNSKTRKGDLEWVGEAPVQTHFATKGRKISVRTPSARDLALIEQANVAPIPYWVPNVPFDRTREMWRGSHRTMGIGSAADFFTRRNLHALAAIRHAIFAKSEGRVREALMFAFTAAVNRASKRYQWNAKRPTNVMMGTLYISSLRYEWNVWSLFKRKVADVLRYYESFRPRSAVANVFQRSAAELDCIPDGAVDMVFMDPPFGSNIFYADASLLWESWLGQITDESREMVVNKSRKPEVGGHSLSDYRHLMSEAFTHVRRVLKPSGKAVLAFSNSDDEVWMAVQDSLQAAGLSTESAHVLDKGQPSIKGVKGKQGKEVVTTYDLLMVLGKKTSVAVSRASANLAPRGMLLRVVRSLLTQNECATDEVYSDVIRTVLAEGYSVSGITMPFVEDLCVEVGGQRVDGRWQITSLATEHAPASGVISGYLEGQRELPVGNGGLAPSSPPAARSVAGGRGSPFYSAHSYHTKVPPEAIVPFIEHFTQPGDVVLDPFCGSGATGVAAVQTGRRSILNDLAPAAIHLAWNHTHEVDPAMLDGAFRRLVQRVGEEVSSLYSTRHEGVGAEIAWTMWSAVYVCPNCSSEFSLWSAINRNEGRVARSINCVECHVSLNRSELKAITSAPVWLAGVAANGKRFERALTEAEAHRARSFARESIPHWYPDVPIEATREMYVRCALHLQQIRTVADFYTPRNLHALSAIWAGIQLEPDIRLRRALAFAFTNTAWHGTRMRRFNARGGQRPLTGTLYVPQLSSEANVLHVMANKIKQLQRYYRTLRVPDGCTPAMLLGSAANLERVKSDSVDYIFTDPPFGSNLFYADCNLIWESWLGSLTERDKEIVVHRSQRPADGGKTIHEYGELMSKSMAEMYRVLKPGGWATVVFHNTDGSVWNAIQTAAHSAGFESHAALSLDRKQQSHKGYKGRAGDEDVAHFDVVFNLRKASARRRSLTASKRLSKASLRKLIEQISLDPVVKGGGVQAIHAEVMRTLASSGQTAYPDFSEVREVCQALGLSEKVVNREFAK